MAVQGMFSEMEEERMSECQQERQRKVPRLRGLDGASVIAG